MVEMLELSHLEFKTTVINVLRAPMYIVDSVQEIDGQWKQRKGNSKKGPKWNPRDKKYFNRNEE